MCVYFLNSPYSLRLSDATEVKKKVPVKHGAVGRGQTQAKYIMNPPPKNEGERKCPGLLSTLTYAKEMWSCGKNM